MATYSKLTLSGSTNGQQILVTATTSGSAIPLHTAVSTTSSYDEIWIYAYNESTASVQCSILWGSTTEPNAVNRLSIPSQAGRILVVDGKLLNNALTVLAYASIANVIAIDGFVNRIAP